MFCCLQVKPLGFLKPPSLTKVAGRFKAHQESLPRLPVPPLQQTLDHYLRTLQPIVSEEEWAHTKQLVEEFQAAGGVGERLQKGLERRAKKMENWVSRHRTGTDAPGPTGAKGNRGPPPPEALSPTVRSAPAAHRLLQTRPRWRTPWRHSLPGSCSVPGAGQRTGGARERRLMPSKSWHSSRKGREAIRQDSGAVRVISVEMKRVMCSAG